MSLEFTHKNQHETRPLQNEAMLVESSVGTKGLAIIALSQVV